MPQFDFAHVFWPQLVWLAVFFAILYFGIVRLTLPKLGRVMMAREDQVTGDLSTAESAKAEADRMATEYESGIVMAQETARHRLNDARAAAAKSLEVSLAASKALLDAQAVQAQTALDVARDRALGQIESVSAEAAADIVEKLTGVRPEAATCAVAVRAAMV